jgi:hypothetical protein
MRVKQPDEDDWGKLKCVLKYLCCTCSLPLTLFADSLTSIVWYTLIPLIRLMTTAKVTPDLPSLLAMEPRGFHLQNKNFLQKVLQKVSSLVSMTNQATSYGHVSFLKHRVTKLLTILSTKIT